MLPPPFAAGSLYWMADVLLKLPGDRERRTQHPRRIVLIVSDQNQASGTNALPSSEWPSVLIVPVSSATMGRTRFDVRIPAGAGNLERRGWARVPALQVVDKDHLQDYLGMVTQATLDAVTAQILNYLGLIPQEDASDTPLP